MQNVFEHIGGKPIGLHTAALGESGKLTAKPDRIAAEAIKQWSKMQRAKLDENLAREYGASVMPTIASVPPEEEAEDNFTAKELRAALRAMRGTAAGLGQFPAELLSQAPEDAIGKLGLLGPDLRERRVALPPPHPEEQAGRPTAHRVYANSHEGHLQGPREEVHGMGQGSRPRMTRTF